MIQEARGLVRGFPTRASVTRGFERFNKVESKTPADFEQKEVSKYGHPTRASNQAEVDKEVARIIRGLSCRTSSWNSRRQESE